MIEKMARFRCSASTSLNWGEVTFISHFVLSKIVAYVQPDPPSVVKRKRFLPSLYPGRVGTGTRRLTRACVYSSPLILTGFAFVTSSRHNQYGKPVRQAVDSSEQMATPALFHSEYKLLSGRDGERMVTQESHPGG